MEPTTSPEPPPEGKPTVPALAHSLTLSSGAVFAASLVVQLLGLVATFFLARHIGISPTGLALLGTAQLFLLIASSINGLADLRLGTAYTYYLARGKPPRESTTTYLLVGMAMDAAVIAVLFVLAPLAINGAALVHGSSEWLDLGLFLTLPIFWSFSGLYISLFIGLGNSLKAQYPTLVEGVVRLAALIYVAFYVHSIEGIAIAYVIGATASTIFSLPALLPQLSTFRWREAVAMFRFSWPLMGALFINYVVTNLTPFLVVSLSTAQLSIYLAANGWRILVLSLPAAVTTPLFPYLAGLHKKREFETLRQSTWQALRYSAMLLVPGVVALVTYRTNFLNIFQNHLYAVPGSLPLAILVVGALPLAFSQIIQSSINAIGRQRLELYITATQVAVLLVAQVILFPSPAQHGIFPIFWRIVPANLDPGLVAASVAVLLSSVAALGLNTYFMERLIKVHIRPGPILAISASAAGSFASLWLLNHLHFFPVSTWYELLSAVILGFAVYFLILAGVGELTRADVRRIGASMGLPAWIYGPLTRFCWRERAPEFPPIDLSLAQGFQTTELPEMFTGTREFPDLVPFTKERRPDEEEPPTKPGV
ncbi:MAG TPA: oligosaccharide flippase family protein [Thermoplasmata archaeon]|nr:oligosaccharide flippase family protein [Thermoplasmata archaeon]